MFVSFLIIGISVVLFVYWFRYTVLLILRTRTTAEYAQKVAAANQLAFVHVRQELQREVLATDLSSFARSLEKDYGILKYLLGHAATIEVGGYTAEQRLLMLNYRMLALWCWGVRRFNPSAAKTAMVEMSAILEYFANVMGQRLAMPASQPVRL
jgi:hypothetical protein